MILALCCRHHPGPAVLVTANDSFSRLELTAVLVDRLLGSMNGSFAGRYDSFARLDLVFGTQHKAAEALLEECRAGTIDLP